MSDWYNLPRPSWLDGPDTTPRECPSCHSATAEVHDNCVSCDKRVCDRCWVEDCTTIYCEACYPHAKAEKEYLNTIEVELFDPEYEIVFPNEGEEAA